MRGPGDRLAIGLKYSGDGSPEPPGCCKETEGMKPSRLVLVSLLSLFAFHAATAQTFENGTLQQIENVPQE